MECISALELLQWKAASSGQAELVAELGEVLRAVLAHLRQARADDATAPAAIGDDEALPDAADAADEDDEPADGGDRCGLGSSKCCSELLALAVQLPAVGGGPCCFC